MGKFMDIEEDDLEHLIFAISFFPNGVKVQGHHFDDFPELKMMVCRVLVECAERMSQEIPDDLKSEETYDKDGNIVETVVYGTAEAFRKKAN